MVIIFSVTGCGGDRKKGKVLAKIDDRVITLEEFNERISVLPKHFIEMIKGQKMKYLDEIIKEELLYNEALKSNIGDDEDIQKVIREAQKKILISGLLKKRIDDLVSVSDEEAKMYYDEHSEEFMLPNRWRASHILVDTIQEAEEIVEKLKQDASFEELAFNRSKDPTGKKDGDVGYFSKGQLVPEFEEACLKLEVGEIGEIVRTQFGYHIIKLTEKKGPEVQDFYQVEELIKKELRREERLDMLDQLITQLRSEVKITINEELLKEDEEKPQKDEDQN